MQSDQSSRPHLQCLWTADASSLAHQVTNDSSHRFNRAGGRRQLEIRMFAIGPELIGPSEKFSDYHADTDRTARLTDQLAQTLKGPLELGTIGKLQCLTGKLIANLTHVSACDFFLSSSSVAMQLADEMEMTKLQDPAFLDGQRGDASNLVGNQGAYTLLYFDRYGVDGLRPAIDLFPTGKKQRVEENSAALMTRPQGHQVQHLRTLVEAKVKTVDQKDERPSQFYNSRARHKTTHELMKPVAQGPMRKTVVTARQIFQRVPLQKNGLQQFERRSPWTPSKLFLPDSPRSFAVTAPTAARTKTVHFGPATMRFRMQRLHARELCDYSRSKSARFL
jgi:hypothetical protein